MQVEVEVKFMQTNFGGHGLFGFGVMAPFACLRKRPNGLSSFGDIATSKIGQISFSDLGL